MSARSDAEMMETGALAESWAWWTLKSAGKMMASKAWEEARVKLGLSPHQPEPTKAYAMAGMAATVGVGLASGLSAVGGALSTFTPVRHPGAIERWMDVLGRLGRESDSQRLTRQVRLVYRSFIGLILAKTLHGLHENGAHEMRDALVRIKTKPESMANDVAWSAFYHAADGTPLNYYGEVKSEHATLLTTHGWDAMKTPLRAVINILLGMVVYAERLFGMQTGSTAIPMDKILKIICYEEVLCRLLKIHGYGVLSAASYWISQTLDTGWLPWETPNKTFMRKAVKRVKGTVSLL